MAEQERWQPWSMDYDGQLIRGRFDSEGFYHEERMEEDYANALEADRAQLQEALAFKALADEMAALLHEGIEIADEEDMPWPVPNWLARYDALKASANGEEKNDG